MTQTQNSLLTERTALEATKRSPVDGGDDGVQSSHVLFTENPAQPTIAFVNEICPVATAIYSRGLHSGRKMTSRAEWTTGHYRESSSGENWDGSVHGLHSVTPLEYTYTCLP